METFRLLVRERQETGDGPARRLRAQGLIPGVTYAKGKAATAISVSLDDLKVAMAHGQNVILELDFAKSDKKATKGTAKTAAKGASQAARYAVVKEIQLHPTKRRVLHIDLHEVDLAEEIEAPVIIEAVGTPAGVADGGIMEWERREVNVRALPGDIPPALQLDVDGLEIGEHRSIGDLTAPEGVAIVDDPEAVVVALVPPRVEQPPAVEEEEEEAEVEEELEPELVGGPTPEVEE